MSESQSGSAYRARLAAAGRAAGSARGAALAGPRPSFEALCVPPVWLTLVEDERRQVAGLAGLLEQAGTLACCVDGRILAPLAEAFGEDALDAVMARGGDAPAGPSAELTPDALRARGDAILAAASSGDPEASRLIEAAMALLPPAEERMAA
jgi:hypothetical protein